MTRFPAHGLGARAQRGVVLFIALIVLVAMALASVALIRSVDTATLGAGNIAFKQSASLAAERAIAAAIAQFESTGFFATVANTNAHQAAYNYCASLLPTDSRGVPLVLLNLGNKECDGRPRAGANEVVSATGERLRYVIERLCSAPGPVDQSMCSVAQLLPTGGTLGGPVPLGVTLPLYRVTVRVDGPRGTVHFAQVLFKP